METEVYQDDDTRRRSVSRLIKRKKDRKAKDDKSTSSAGNSDLSVNTPDLRRVSSDGPIDRLKERVRSIDAASQSSDGITRRLSNKLPGRRRKSVQAPGSSPGPQYLSVLPKLDPRSISTRNGQSKSDDSLGRAESISSDLLTEDEDVPQPNARPALVTRDSHAGYLTLSSPLISAETVDPSPNKTVPPESVTPLLDKVDSKNRSTDNLTAPKSDKRSTSPVGRLKEALSISRKSSSQSLKDEGSLIKGSKSGRTNATEVSAASSEEKKNETASQPSADVQKLNATAHEANPRPKTPQPIITVDLPQTPPSRSETPSTLVTPPTPTNFTFSPPSTQTTPKSVSKGSPVAPLNTRRMRTNSNAPSKLSNSIPAPLTPTLEETKTPGGTLTAATSSGFFASVFTATQNAANQLTNSITNPSFFAGNQRSRSGTSSEHIDKTGPAGGEEVITSDGVGQSTESRAQDVSQENRQLAVETLGSGNLSLSHLGISDTPLEPAKPSMAGERTANGSVVQTEAVMAHAEDDAAARAVSAAYLEKPNGDKGASSDVDKAGRPKSIGAQSDLDTQTPTRAPSVVDEGNSLLRRTGSVRSKISTGRKRRHRGSSATTGNTIAAAITASNATLANPGTGPKLTGFAVANPKRNRDFHQLFRSVPEDDYLIEDYSAALQRDILLQGRLYISEGHVCFSSNILGWVTNLVISFDEIVSVEKKTTAVIFPNAIVIQTLHARNVFASFVTRDTTYDLLINIWKINHPNLKSSLNGVTLDDSGGTGDKTEKAASIAEEGSEETTDDSDDDVYDEDAEEDDATASFVDTTNGDADGGAPAADDEKTVSRKVSAAVVGATVAGGAAKLVDAVEAAAGIAQTIEFPGPTTHEPTDCGDSNTHYEKPLTDVTIPAPLGKIYNLIFGPGSGAFMRKFLIDDQKSLDLQLDDKAYLDEKQKSMNFSYIKPLSGSIGPKQTKCIISQTLEQFDLEKAVTINCSTQNPDVPSGNIFVVKTRYCLTWGVGNSTRLVTTCQIEWSGKSWLKGPIEKGANDGQNQYAKDLTAALRAAVASKAPPKSLTKGLKGAKKRGKKEGEAGADQDPLASTAPPADIEKKSNWGALEPLRAPLEPVVEALGNTRALIGFLTVMVLWLWWTQPRATSGVGYGGAHPGRIAAYEEMWRQEESELWRWLDSRVGGADAVADALLSRAQRPVGQSNSKAKGRDETSPREMQEAIRLTREKLEVLEAMVQRGKEKV